MRSLRRACVAVAIAGLVSSAALQATVMIPTDLPDVTASASLIVRGRVVDTRAFADVANGPVTTAVTLGVSEVLKGTADRSVTFLVHGGELGRYRQVVIGSPTFVAGDDAYVFLRRSADGALWVSGMSAGVYKVSSVDGTAMVNPPVVAGLTATAGAQIARGDSRRKPMRVSDFSGLVKLLMVAGTGRTGGPDRTDELAGRGRVGASGRGGGGR